MGILDKVAGKKKEAETTKLETTQETGREENQGNIAKAEIYGFLAEEVMIPRDPEKGTMATVTVGKEKVRMGDVIYILGAGGTVWKSSIVYLENQEGKSCESLENEAGHMLIAKTPEGALKKYDLITNEEQEEWNVDQPVKNPRLAKLFEIMSQNRTVEIMNQVYQEIAEGARFLSVIALSEEPVRQEDGSSALKKESLMQFPLLATTEGKAFFPAFIDWAELGKWKGMEEPKTLVLGFDDYVAMLMQNETAAGIVINPFGHGMVLEREMLNHLKKVKGEKKSGFSRQVVEKDTQVMIGNPSVYPEEMVESIRTHLQNEPGVSKVWLRMMIKQEEKSYLLVVDYSGDRNEIFRGIANVAKPYLQGMFLDMVPVTEPFGKQATEGIEPFYG